MRRDSRSNLCRIFESVVCSSGSLHKIPNDYDVHGTTLGSATRVGDACANVSMSRHEIALATLAREQV